MIAEQDAHMIDIKPIEPHLCFRQLIDILLHFAGI